MPSAIPRLAVASLSLGYLVCVHFALTRDSSVLAATATAFLGAGVIVAVKGPHRKWLRLLGVAMAAWFTYAIGTRTIAPIPLLLPPILVPATLAWIFGRTLVAGRKSLVERFMRIFHAPEVPPPEFLRYARHVTQSWTALLAILAAANLVLLMNLVPGGLLELAHIRPPWPMSPTHLAWLGNLVTYLLIGGMFLAEFAVRIVRFPRYRYRNPVRFLRQARHRLPAIVEEFRRG